MKKLLKSWDKSQNNEMFIHLSLNYDLLWEYIPKSRLNFHHFFSLTGRNDLPNTLTWLNPCCFVLIPVCVGLGPSSSRRPQLQLPADPPAGLQEPAVSDPRLLRGKTMTLWCNGARLPECICDYRLQVFNGCHGNWFVSFSCHASIVIQTFKIPFISFVATMLKII